MTSHEARVSFSGRLLVVDGLVVYPHEFLMVKHYSSSEARVRPCEEEEEEKEASRPLLSGTMT